MFVSKGSAIEKAFPQANSPAIDILPVVIECTTDGGRLPKKPECNCSNRYTGYPLPGTKFDRGEGLASERRGVRVGVAMIHAIEVFAWRV